MHIAKAISSIFYTTYTPTWVNNWDRFHMELETNFSPFNPVREAKAEIEMLVMVEGSCSMIYFMEFNRLASCIQWDDHALLQQAYKGLAHHIKNEMVLVLLQLRLVAGYKP